MGIGKNLLELCPDIEGVLITGETVIWGLQEGSGGLGKDREVLPRGSQVAYIEHR